MLTKDLDLFAGLHFWKKRGNILTFLKAYIIGECVMRVFVKIHHYLYLEVVRDRRNNFEKSVSESNQSGTTVQSVFEKIVNYNNKCYITD